MELAESLLGIGKLSAKDVVDIGVYRWLWAEEHRERFVAILAEADKLTSDLALALKMKESDVAAARAGDAGASASSSSEAKILDSALGMFYSA